MRKIGAFIAIVALLAVIFAPPPAAAFGLRIGPFHIGIPLYFPRFRHRLYMRANPNDLARPESEPAISSPLIYPNRALPGIFQSIFTPASASPWPFGYERIFSTAFAEASASADPRLCQPAVDPNPIVGRIQTEVTPTADQQQLLQKLGGALGAAAGFLAKSCPTEIPAQPVARLQLMELQIEELAMAVDIIRQPLQEFEQSLNAEQQEKFSAVATASAADPRQPSDPAAQSCGGSSMAVDSSIDQIEKSVQPTDAQRPALNDMRAALGKVADDLQAHCPTSVPATAVGRMEAIEARLDATWRSELGIQVALANFETKLSDEQKDRFDRINFAAR